MRGDTLWFEMLTLEKKFWFSKRVETSTPVTPHPPARLHVLLLSQLYHSRYLRLEAVRLALCLPLLLLSHFLSRMHRNPPPPPQIMHNVLFNTACVCTWMCFCISAQTAARKFMLGCVCGYVAHTVCAFFLMFKVKLLVVACFEDKWIDHDSV